MKFFNSHVCVSAAAIVFATSQAYGADTSATMNYAIMDPKALNFVSPASDMVVTDSSLFVQLNGSDTEVKNQVINNMFTLFIGSADDSLFDVTKSISHAEVNDAVDGGPNEAPWYEIQRNALPFNVTNGFKVDVKPLTKNRRYRILACTVEAKVNPADDSYKMSKTVAFSGEFTVKG